VHAVAVLIELVRLLDGFHVEAPMLGEFLIFRRHDRERQIGRNLTQIHPTMAERIGAIALLPGRHLGLRHEGGVGRIDPPQQCDQSCAQDDAGEDERQQRPHQPPEE